MEFIEIESNGRTLRGMLHKHQTECKEALPLVIVHGYFSANKIGPQRLFVHLANEISKREFDVFRFDLSGMGESDGIIDNIKFDDHVKDIENIIRTMKEKYNNRVAIVSHCLGCNTTLENVLTHSDWFREIIFLAPYYTTEDTLSRFFGEISKKQLYEESYTYRKGLYAHSSFFKRSMQTHFIDAIKKAKVTINVIIPENDQYISLESNNDTFKGIEKINLNYIKNADHNFLESQKELICLIERLLLDEKFTI